MGDDGSWDGLPRWERVRWARSRKFETATAAAESMGMRPNTYSAYERRPDSSKHTALDHQAAARFAKKFGVRWEWLLSGEGTPWPGGEPDAPAMRVVNAMNGLSRDRQEEIASAMVALIKARNAS